MSDAFSYGAFTTRNIGFVTEAEQARLRAATVFVCGTGGMGGAALLALARAGVGNFIVADIDSFEVSNLNRQVFAFTDTVGRHKAEAIAEAIARINPEAKIEVLRAHWMARIVRITLQVKMSMKGTDARAACLCVLRATFCLISLFGFM